MPNSRQSSPTFVPGWLIAATASRSFAFVIFGGLPPTLPRARAAVPDGVLALGGDMADHELLERRKHGNREHGVNGGVPVHHRTPSE